MKSEYKYLAAVSTLIMAGFCVAPGFGQGTLTPPGPPGATMLTLSQVEPRTPISSLPYTIAKPGSYYLTTNLFGVSGTNGITVLSSNVTIDLRGFTLQGAPGALTGIEVAGTLINLFQNIVIRNGTISDWPENGLDADNSINSQFSDLNLSHNSLDGLNPGFNAIVHHCNAANNGLEGYGGDLDQYCLFEDCIGHDSGDAGFATQSNCSFRNCNAFNDGNEGFNAFVNCTFQDCIAVQNGTGFYSPYDGCVFEHCNCGFNNDDGMLAGDNCTIRDLVSINNGGDGIDAGNACILESCSASFNLGGGINVSNQCTLTGCAAYTNQLDNFTTMGGCTLSQCSAGNSVGNGFTLGVGNTITASTAFGNATNGIDAGDRSSVRSCTATFNGNAGIHVNFQGTVQQCTSGNNGSYGIFSDNNGYASIIENNCSFNGILTYGGTPTQGAGICITNSPGCRVEGNTLDINYAALVVAPNNHAFILRNSADGNVFTNYSLGSGNSWGPIINATAGGDVSTIPNSSHPDANFIH